MREDFKEWLAQLRDIIYEDMLSWGDEFEPYDYIASTGEECWQEMYDEGMIPSEAWQEEKDAIAQSM